MANLIELKNITYKYNEHAEPALQDIHMTVKSGEWISVIGPGSAGKSTLCRLLCGVLQSWPEGSLSGKYWLDGMNQTAGTAIDFAGKIGVVFEDPEVSIVQDAVEDEIAFGPENMKVDPAEIERRVDEALLAVDLLHLKKRSTHALSGGQMQRVNIASMLAMKPQIIILDDAAANLDHESSSRLLNTLKELHKQGHTIISLSSRYNEDEPSDKIYVLHKGRIVLQANRAELLQQHSGKLQQLGCLPDSAAKKQYVYKARKEQSAPLLKANNLSYSYSMSGDAERLPVLHQVNVIVEEGDFLIVTGPNGAGKTTLGKLIAGMLPAEECAIELLGKPLEKWDQAALAEMVGYVFQMPEHQFVADTVLEECAYTLQARAQQIKDKNDRIRVMKQDEETAKEWLERFGLASQMDQNPYQLSAADKRCLTLASVLIGQPRLIILDEPTAGLDYASTDRLLSHCADYVEQGHAVIMITHDKTAAEKWANKTLALQPLDLSLQ